MRGGFLLDPDVAYLNHGSFGACPVEVFEEYRSGSGASARGGWARTDQLRIEAAVYEWEGRRILRVSIGPYNDEEDVERLVDALRALVT
jgi:selenocysteine lyase/cysteine desulfurase